MVGAPGNDWQKFGFFVLIQLVAMALYTCVNLPYAALACELTTDTPCEPGSTPCASPARSSLV